jgi:hypothetical protein
MRLINYGAGEIADRLTILSLKLHHAERDNKPLDHFRNEYTALLTKLKAGNGISGYVEALLELATVNGRLWDAEDELRAFRNDPPREGIPMTGSMGPYGIPGSHKHWVDVATCAFKIQTLNDRRAELVAEINTQTGEHRGPEKLS